MQLLTPWATPIVITRMPGYDEIKSSLISYLTAETTKERYSSHHKRDTQYGIYESNFYLHKDPDQNIQKVFGFIHASLASTVFQLSVFNQQDFENVIFNYHSWYHLTQKGGYQTVHNHPGASWSGIFCICLDETVTQDKTGNVRFMDPRSNADMYLDPANERLRSPYGVGGFKVAHQPGQLVIFPSYLYHEVMPYEGEQTRIVIAFNSWCTANHAYKSVS
ncbi:MAG TPA: TIGR02466 family protein [Permianibacter sp.]|nr:TIGR02466 family protein [Permianibacter sp.]